MNNSGSSASDPAPTNASTNAGITIANEAERNIRPGSTLEDATNKSSTALNSDGMQISAGTNQGKYKFVVFLQILPFCAYVLIPNRCETLFLLFIVI